MFASPWGYSTPLTWRTDAHAHNQTLWDVLIKYHQGREPRARASRRSTLLRAYAPTLATLPVLAIPPRTRADSGSCYAL